MLLVFQSEVEKNVICLVSSWNLLQLYSSLIDIRLFVGQFNTSQFLPDLLKDTLKKTSHLTILNQNSDTNFNILASRMSAFVFWLHLVILYPPQHMYMHPCPGRFQSVIQLGPNLIFAKRPHCSGGLSWSRRWDALQLGDSLHSFSQQLTPSAAAQMELPSCLVFDGGDWWALGVGVGGQQRAPGCSYQSNKLETENSACLVDKSTHSKTIDGAQ